MISYTSGDELEVEFRAKLFKLIFTHFLPFWKKKNRMQHPHPRIGFLEVKNQKSSKFCFQTKMIVFNHFNHQLHSESLLPPNPTSSQNPNVWYWSLLICRTSWTFSTCNLLCQKASRTKISRITFNSSWDWFGIN